MSDAILRTRDPGLAADAAAAAAQRAADRATEHSRLRRASKDLEGVFVEQLFKSMRETVPDGGLLDGGTGQEMFTTLLDQRLSALTPERWEGGLGDAVYRQLRGVAGVAAAPAAPGGVAPQGSALRGGVSAGERVNDGDPTRVPVTPAATPPTAAQPPVGYTPAATAAATPDTPGRSSSPPVAPILDTSSSTDATRPELP